MTMAWNFGFRWIWPEFSSGAAELLHMSSCAPVRFWLVRKEIVGYNGIVAKEKRDIVADDKSGAKALFVFCEFNVEHIRKYGLQGR